MDENAALVLFSGGQDSATCLAWALERFERVETIGFDYGQRHRIEMEQRTTLISAFREMRPDWAMRLGDDTVLDVPTLAQLGGTAMIEDVAIEMGSNGLPTTFVPGRNILFLTLAGALGYRRGVKHLVTGVCETDYSGYPDCRDDTIKAVQVALNLGMETRLVLHTPLMFVDKAGTWDMAQTLGDEALVEVIRVHSHSCYLGDRRVEHAWGFGCGACPACDLRAAGWQKWVGA